MTYEVLSQQPTGIRPLLLTALPLLPLILLLPSGITAQERDDTYSAQSLHIISISTSSRATMLHFAAELVSNSTSLLPGYTMHVHHSRASGVRSNIFITTINMITIQQPSTNWLLDRCP